MGISTKEFIEHLCETVMVGMDFLRDKLEREEERDAIKRLLGVKRELERNWEKNKDSLSERALFDMGNYFVQLLGGIVAKDSDLYGEEKMSPRGKEWVESVRKKRKRCPSMELLAVMRPAYRISLEDFSREVGIAVGELREYLFNEGNLSEAEKERITSWLEKESPLYLNADARGREGVVVEGLEPNIAESVREASNPLLRRWWRMMEDN